MDMTLLAAFLGGTLALLSPCGALLLPAFFASTVGAGARLLLHGLTFFIGLCLTLVPLGLGASLAGSLVTTHRDLLITGAGLLIILFGVLQIFGVGFDIGALVPGFRSAQSATHRRSGLVRSFLLGLVSGVAGFCSGPILGAVLTMAATEDSPLVAGTMLAVYGAGMVVPLLGIAALWHRMGNEGRSRLRGRVLTIGPLSVHSTSLVTGVLLVVVGVVFLATNGMAGLPELLPATALAQLQTVVIDTAAAVPETLLIVLAAAVVLGVWWWRRRRAAQEAP